MGHVALDGTKIKANASKHKAMSYKRMKEEEVRLEAEVAALLKKAEVVDEEGNCRYGRASGEMSYQKNWLSGRAVCRRYGKPGRRWRKMQSRKQK